MDVDLRKYLKNQSWKKKAETVMQWQIVKMEAKTVRSDNETKVR